MDADDIEEAQALEKKKIDKEENQRMLLEYKKNPSIDLRNQIVENNMGLVNTIAEEYVRKLGPSSSAKYDELLNDFVGEGALALIKAVENFDPSLGYAFSTFATPYIRNSLNTYLTENSRIISIPARTIQKLRAINKKRGELTSKLGREPTDEEVAEAMGDGMTAGAIQRLELSALQPVSADAPKSTLDGEGEAAIVDFQADPDDPSTIFAAKENAQFYKEAVDALTPRERDIFLSRFGPDDSKKKKLRELAEQYSISIERARQIGDQARDKVLAYIKKRS